MPDTDSGRVVVVAIDQDFAYFQEIFRRLRHTFIYSPEVGLDANLSQRVRHGTLAGELRAIFERARLCTKTDLNKHYLPNAHWVDQLNVADDAAATTINRAFAAFSKNLDDNIRTVRERWIQIRSEQAPDGLLDYDFTDDTIGELLCQISPLAEHSDVYEMILATLLERTDRCLQSIRNAITKTLATLLEGNLDRLQAAIDGIEHQNLIDNGAGLRNAIVQCKTGLTRELQQIADWFWVESRHEHKDFLFRDLLESVQQVLKRINVACQATLNEGPIPAKLSGIYFRPLWDILVLLLDNAVRHSHIESVPVKLEAAFSPEFSRLTCHNPVSSIRSVDELRADVFLLNRLTLENPNDLSKIRKEGGSGTAKLHKIVRYDMGRGDGRYRISFSLGEDGAFEVNIDFGAGIV